jgi:hypothetical protein
MTTGRINQVTFSFDHKINTQGASPMALLYLSTKLIINRLSKEFVTQIETYNSFPQLCEKDHYN